MTACGCELPFDGLLFERGGLMMRFILRTSFLADNSGCWRFDRTTGSLYTLFNLPGAMEAKSG
jgi:hypothetical protein